MIEYGIVVRRDGCGKNKMTITCQICKKMFNKQITNSHLKTHNMSTQDYKTIYGDTSLTCDEYKKELSYNLIGEKNPNYGKKLSTEAKESISNKNKNKIPHNKGRKMTEEQLVKHQLSIKKREERYKKTGVYPRTGVILSEETRNKISQGVKQYAEYNTDLIKERAIKAIKTKNKNGGYFELKRKHTLLTREKILNDMGFNVCFFDDYMEIICTKCNTKFNRCSWWETHQNMCPTCYITPSTSKEELELRQWLATITETKDIIPNDRTTFKNGFEIDILLPKYNIGIEYNGLYWHSENNGKNKWYHKTKHTKAIEQGINLIQIFEDEWKYKKEICKNRILSKLGINHEKIYARRCNIIIPDHKIAHDFLENTHIQGKGYGCVYIGLEYNNKIVAVMSFSKMSRSKGFVSQSDNIYELNRYSSIGHVIGGSSKLFKYFIKNYNPETILTYSDLRWNTGEMYLKLGFEYVGETVPSYWYIKNDKRIHRFQLRKNEQDDSSLSEWENRKKQGWNRIWDCGHAKYIWKTPNDN